MPINLKKTNIQYDLDTPETGWVILGVDEDGVLVKKDEFGNYEKIVKDETYGIYLRLETDYLTIGNRVTDSSEGLYSLAQGDFIISSGLSSVAQGKNASSSADYTFSRGEAVKATKTYSFASGYNIYSSGINSFVHSYSSSISNPLGTKADYSVILGGKDNNIGQSANYSSIIGGTNNIINENIINASIIAGTNIIANVPNTLYSNNIKVISNLTTSTLNATTIVTTNLTATTSNLKSISSIGITTYNIEALSGITSNYITANSIAIKNYTGNAFLKANGTKDETVYFNTKGGSLNGNIVLTSKSKSSISVLINDGYSNLLIGTSSFENVTFGNESILYKNTVLGYGNTKNLSTGYCNIVIGTENAINFGISGITQNLVTMYQNIIIGNRIKPLSNGTTNEIIIGNDVVGHGSGTITIGGSSTINSMYLYSSSSLYLMTNNIYHYGVIIHASDERLKTKIRSFNENELNASKEISKEIGFYKFIEIAKSGDNSEHIGMTVQKAIEIMIHNDLNPFDYKFISLSENTNEKYNKYLLDGKIYGFDYTELLLFITRGMEQRLSELEDKI